MNQPPYYPPELTAIVGSYPYWRGAALKYIARAGKKSKETEADDLRKAIDCLQRELAIVDVVAAGASPMGTDNA